MALRKKVQNFNKIIKTYKMKVNQKGMDALHRPSFFQSLNSKMSCPINDLPQIESYITRDTSIKGFTEAYRKRLAIGKKCADELKALTPGISIAVEFDGKGREIDNIKGATGLGLIDIDGLDELELEAVFSKASLASYSCCIYRTISGHGLRIFFKYKRPDDCKLSMIDLYELSLNKAINFYEMLLGKEADRKCTDFTRLSGLAHDEKAFFNWDAAPICISDGDIHNFELKNTKPTPPHDAAAVKRTRKPGGGRKKASSICQKPTMALVAPHVENLMKQWGLAFESGSHNDYVNRFAWTCNLYGIQKEEVIGYAQEHFCGDYAPAISVINSCYKHGTSRFGSWTFYTKDQDLPARPTIRFIKQWLLSRLEFRRNKMTSKIEIRNLLVENAKYKKWTNLEDTIKNSIWVEMNESNMEVSMKKLEAIIDSDFSMDFDPLEEYLKGLAPWDGEHDYIGELADRITIKELPGYFHDQEQFRYFFKKWFVGMVVGWVNPTVINQTILILVGKGGIYKTTFFNYLLPPVLRAYFLNDSSANYMDKDFLEAFFSMALICLDELEAIFGKNLSAFKSNMTKQKFSIRRPYDKYRSELRHRSSLAATSNSIQIIPDEENRRYSPWQVKCIVSPIENPLEYDKIYAQAVALGQKVVENRKKGLKNDWVYWLTNEDIEKMKVHNRYFMVVNLSEEQVKRFYTVPDIKKAEQYGTRLKFRYNAEIMERICTNPAMRQNITSQSIGYTMSRLGFPKAHRSKGNGWWVIEKEGAEINTDALFSMADARSKEEDCK